MRLLLIAGAIAWFAPAPISRASNAVVISASRDRVWGVVSDLSSARHWDPGMKEVKLVSDAKTGDGTIRASDGLLGKTMERVRESLSFNRLKLDVTTHVPIHGAPSPHAQFEQIVGPVAASRAAAGGAAGGGG